MSLGQSLYWICSDVLSLIIQMRNSKDLPPCDVLQRRVMGLFETMMQNGRDAQIPEQDMIDVKFALAAFADEVVYNQTWNGRTQWLSNPLQLQFFGINTAGDVFFTNLDNLYGQRGRTHVAEIYYLCLALGFQGRYRLRNLEGLAPIVEGVGNYVALAEGTGKELAPNALRREARAGVIRREMPYLALAGGFFAVALLIVAILRITLNVRSGAVIDGITATIPR